MDDEKVLGKITKLLEQGCTMLATHHDCGAPLFRCKGEVVCPVCSFPDQDVSKDLSHEAEPSVSQREGQGAEGGSPDVVHPSALKHPGQEKSTASSDEQVIVEEELKSAILSKLRELSGDLRQEHDLSKLNGQLCCIDSAVKVLRSLSR